MPQEATNGETEVMLHWVIAFCAEHEVAQLPQWLVLSSGVSQPVAALESQSPKPVLQLTIAQVPPVQVSLALVVEQAWPQVPQLAVLPVTSISQPSAGL